MDRKRIWKFTARNVELGYHVPQPRCKVCGRFYKLKGGRKRKSGNAVRICDECRKGKHLSKDESHINYESIKKIKKGV